MRRISSLIDEIDAQIVTLLQADGRTPNTEIARQLGLAEATVRKRIARMLRHKVMQVGAWADPHKIGYQVHVILEIEVDLWRLDAAARHVASMPEVFFVGTCTGHVDILAAAVFRDHDHLHEFMTRRLGRVSGIRRTHTLHITQTVKRHYSFLLDLLNGPGRKSRPGKGRETRPSGGGLG
jgi:Lrp/AsnC family transcriptional regulator for asnA, asnC and gidA